VSTKEPVGAVASLPSKTREILSTVVKPTFNAYMAATRGSTRAVWCEHGSFFHYPPEITTADIVVMWALFVRVYEALDDQDALAQLVKADEHLLSDVRAIVEGDPGRGQEGSFWQFSNGGLVPVDEAVGPKLSTVLKTLRDGFAHSHWFFADLSALEYWQALGWETAGAHAEAFALEGRPARNYTMYVADAKNWGKREFWSQEDLRILVTPSHILRFHLHLLLNWLLNESRENIFQS
jgi:hypothetical protein